MPHPTLGHLPVFLSQKGRPAAAGAPFIAGAAGDGTHFVDQTGSPRLMVNEDIWNLICNGGAWGDPVTTWNTYFAQRAAQGYTTSMSSWASFPFPDANNAAVFTDGRDWDGTWPFSGNMDPTTTPNATFWQRRDQFFAIALSYGFSVVLNVTTPWLSGSPATAQATWTTTQWQTYGTFLGNRYKNVPNLLWIIGDDYFGTVDTGLEAFYAALRATGDNHLFSCQLYQEGTSRQDLSTLAKDPIASSVHAQYEWVYTYNVCYDGIEKAQLYTPTVSDDVQHVVPPLWGDGAYLASSTSAGQTDVRLERQMIWWALSSGAAGFSTGDNNIWGWPSSAPATVTSKTFYTQTMPAIARSFGGLPGWQRLFPDTSSQLVTAGRGTHAAAIASGGSGTYYTSNTDNYVTASRTPDTGSGSSLAVIYCGLAMNITIDQSKMRAGYTATWIDPVNGATQAGTVGSTYNSTTQVGNNSAGDPDWVLVLRG